jgi:hypothetical protein
MKAVNYFRIKLFWYLIFISNLTWAQDTFTWTGAVNTNWSTAANWTKTGTASTDTFPGQTLNRRLDIVNITNGGRPVVAANANSYGMLRLTISNNATVPTGSVLTINSGATLDVGIDASNNIVLNGGSIVNNGNLNISSSGTGFSGFPVYGFNCGNPVVVPSSPTEFGYSGTGNLSINLSGANFALSSLVAVTGTTTSNATYKMVFNNPTITFNQSSTASIGAFRVAGGATGCNLLIGGSMNIGSIIAPTIGYFISLGAGGTATIDANANYTFNSSAGNVNNLISTFSTTSVATNFTNKGTLNLQGASLRAGFTFSSGASGTASVFNIRNEGIMNVNLNCVRALDAPFHIGNGGGGPVNAGTIVNLTNSGVMTLKNTATTAGTGFPIFISNAGETAPLLLNNTGTLNLEGSTYNYGVKSTINNSGVINSNSEFRSFVAINNIAGASINFIKTTASATSRQIVFNGLQAANVSGNGGNVYSDGTNNYTVVVQKFSSGTSLVANVLSTATVPSSGTLTLASGSGGTSPITFTAISLSPLEAALTSNATNDGIISTDTASKLNIISGVSNNSTGVISPGGLTGTGIADFSRSNVAALRSTLTLQVNGSTTAGVDFDQITNSSTGGGFDVSGAILAITALYTPSANVVIPIVTASATGSISGTFASVTGLTTGWRLVYGANTISLFYSNAISSTPIIWTGAVNNDFFTEANWRDSQTNLAPANNTINPNTNINLSLQVNSGTSITSVGGVIQFGTGSLSISNANLSATALSGGKVIVNQGGYIELSSTTPLLNTVQINFTSGLGWIRTLDYNPTAIATFNIAQILVSNASGIYTTNLRLDQYYEKGCVIRANISSTTPLTIYDGANIAGSTGLITVNTIHRDSLIANALNNKIESFILKKGFMVTFANEFDGTGKSINYIASESDLTINTLPRTLQNAISFIRVLPWNWVAKKGRNVVSDFAVNTTWRYQWNPNDSSILEHEFAPMAWGHGSADNAAAIKNFIDKYNAPYVMSFNEPDDCDGQSGQYGNPKLCIIDQAVKLHKNLMKTGMRIVSPGGREEAPFGWLRQFYDAAKAQDVRVDVLAVHWYDWGSNPTTTDGATGDQVFNRFKTYLTNVYNAYGLPIWITEFNANPARSQAVNARFLELALPYLESLSYIERYCWFPFDFGTHFSAWDQVTDTEINKVLGPVGTIYKNINNSTPTQSTPSIPEATISDANSLNLDEYPNIALGKPATASSSFSTYVPAYAVDGDRTNTNFRWLADFSAVPLPAWLEIDLQGSFLVDSFRIFEDSNFGGKPSKDFNFQIWDASLNAGLGGWVNALTVTGNPATSFTTYKTLSPVSTTKVRLFITAHNNTSGYIRMFELEVYGTPSSPVWVGNTSTSWTAASNWSTSAVPNGLSNVTIPSGRPFQPTISTSQSMKTLTIEAGAALTVNSGINITVLDDIRNSGIMTIANNTNLLQGEAFNNTGNITINRNSSDLSRLDYTLWSSPVNNSSHFLTTFSPETSLTRFYTYDQFSNLYNVIASPATTSFASGTGYLIRMPNTAVTAPATQTFTGVFSGIPNNGVIRKTLANRGTIYGYNLIGNPYPSTLDANLFIERNTSRIESTLYFWRKKNGVAGSSYATWNLTGSVGTGVASGSSAIPNGTIQVGQGFFVKAKNTSNLFVDFENTMRLGTNSTQFFKTKKEEKDRFWLNLTTISGIFSQTLIGYIPGATFGVDDFDGQYINDSPIAITSKINDNEYTIQGRPAFDISDTVALNFKTDVAGEYTIALDHSEGVFAAGQNIYLLDSKTGIETNLKSASYTFKAAAEIDNTRFSLKYQKNLKVDTTTLNDNTIRVHKQNGTLYINSDEVGLTNVKVYNLQGRLIFEQKNLNTTFTTIKDVKAVNQILILKMTRADNSVVTRKVLK